MWEGIFSMNGKAVGLKSSRKREWTKVLSMIGRRFVKPELFSKN